jgi:hypothetical protein
MVSISLVAHDIDVGCLVRIKLYSIVRENGADTLDRGGGAFRLRTNRQ